MTNRIMRRAQPDEVWAGLVAPVTRLADPGDGPQLCLPLAESYSIPVDCWIVEDLPPPPVPVVERRYIEQPALIIEFG